MEELLASSLPYILATAAIVLILAKAFEVIVRAIAPLTKSKKDDAIVLWLDAHAVDIEKAINKVKEWADPKNPSVPPSPK